jgi:acetylornithine deacetylase
MGDRAYRPEVRGGRLYGRGSCDAKGQLAAMLWAMSRLRADSERLRANVVCIAAIDEEHGFEGSQAIVADGLRADGAIVGEPTCLQPVIAHKGVVRWGIQVLGRAAHSSRPQEGVNAITGMLEVLAALRASWESTLVTEHPLLGRATATIVSIEGGLAPNVVPDRCRATIDRRTLPGEDPDDVLRACDGVLDQLRQAAPAWQVEREEPFLHDYALETDPHAPVVQATVEAIRRVTGRQTTPGAVAYATDASKLSRLGGIPCVVLGAGDIAHAHTADEFVPLDEVAQAAEIYYETARLFGEGYR